MKGDLKQLHEKWDDFLMAWPVDRVQKMTLSEYAEAGDNATFTRWM